MAKNITLKLDENVLKKCRHAAVESDKSVSKWLTDLILEKLEKENTFVNAKQYALLRLEQGFHLGGKPLDRESIYER